MPSEAIVTKACDFLRTSRGVEAFFNDIPAASVYGLLEGLKSVGLDPGGLGIMEELMNARLLFLTPDSTTACCMTELDIKDGPIVCADVFADASYAANSTAPAMKKCTSRPRRIGDKLLTRRSLLSGQAQSGEYQIGEV